MGEFGLDVVAAFHVAGDDDEAGLGDLGGGSGEEEFFTRVGGEGHENGAGAQAGEKGLEVGEVAGGGLESRVEFDGTGEVEGFGFDADGLEAGEVGLALSADEGEFLVVGGEEGAGGLEAGVGAGGEAGVDEGEGDFSTRGVVDEVGPDFGFDEDDLGGLVGGEHALDGRGKVEGGVEDLAVCGGVFGGDFEAGGGAEGEEEFLLGVFLVPAGDEFEGDVGFADADGVEVDEVFTGLGTLVVVDGEFFPEAGGEAVSGGGFAEPEGGGD